MDIRILHEDNNIIVCIKPVGLLSEEGGLPDALAQQCRVEKIYCVHRLDRAVGGLMVYAKNARAAAALTESMSRGEFQKEYLALVHGRPAEPEGTYNDLLFKDSRKNKSFVVTRMRKGVKQASLSYRLLAGAEGLSLVRIRLHTGRSHQIRVQFSSRKMPLAGDVKYGSSIKDSNICLWSESLSFPGMDGRQLSFSAPPPKEGLWRQFEL